MMNQPTRCPWCGNDDLYINYHDKEWGKQVKDDAILFEFLILESAQAGLSWITILRKRENYRKLFHQFNAVEISLMDEKAIETILLDSGIIRNRLKVKSAINNAKLFLEIQKKYGSFYQYLYQFLPNQKPIINHFKNMTEVPVSTPISDAIAKDMKKLGFNFFGSTICYAFMQAVGMVNDHLITCDFK